jgi:segregation and condensation protein B
MAEIKKEVEAILFSAGRTVLINEFQSLLGMRNPGLIKDTIRELIDEYITRDSPLMIVSEGEGWKLTVKEKFLPVVQRINPHTELSKTILETLAVISWKQPVLQSAVIKIRTNKAYDHIAELENLGFVTREKHGRSFLIKVTQKFLDYFDLPSSKEIKDVFKDFRDLDVAVQKKADELGNEIQQQEKKSQESSPLVEQPQSNGPAEQVEAGKKEVLPGMVVDTFSDVLPEMKHAVHGNELEVYESSPDQAREVKETESKESETVKPGLADKARSKSVGETAEEKARRIARELLAEDLPHDRREEVVEERQLHPKLEEFIAGSPMPAKRKSREEKSEKPRKEKAAAPEKIKEETVAKPAPDDDREESADVSVDDAEKMAEEFPGQFSEDDGQEEKQ